jgi:hypothetical protein
MASSSRDELTVFTPHPHFITPDAIPPSSPCSHPSAHSDIGGDSDANDDQDDNASITFEDYKRQNRFQLPPEGVTRLLAEAGMDFYNRANGGSRSGGGTVTGTATPGSSRHGKGQINLQARVVDAHETLIGGWEGVRKVIRGDIGCTMRMRGEEGYALENVGATLEAVHRNPAR